VRSWSWQFRNSENFLRIELTKLRDWLKILDMVGGGGGPKYGTT
jgi:hypothetical protein